MFHRRRFFHGKGIRGKASPEITWLDPTGREMSDEAWNTPHVRCLGVHLVGGKIDVDEYGEPIIADHILMLFNADHAVEIPFTLSHLESGEHFEWLFDTAVLKPEGEASLASTYPLQTCSVVVLRSHVDQKEIEIEEPREEVVNQTASSRKTGMHQESGCND